MLWAASCLLFFGFLHLGEVVIPSTMEYDPAYHLGFEDVCVDGHNPTLFKSASRLQRWIQAGDYSVCGSHTEFPLRQQSSPTWWQEGLAQVPCLDGWMDSS